MTVVIKLGGRIQSDAALVKALADLWNSRPGSFCVVHGGGDQVSTVQRQMGREPSFVNGRRITTDEDLEVVRLVLSGSANKRLVSALGAGGLPAVGISGEDGGLLLAEPIDVEKFGRAGKPAAVNIDLIQALLHADFLPVISPVAKDANSQLGEALNVNGDDAAAAIAGALAAELWLLADVPGVMTRDQTVLRSLDASQMEPLVSEGIVSEGMHAKLEAGFAALGAGASHVRIAGIDALWNADAGTFLSLTPSMK
jgi:acetylglutamate kinase